jgi:eukaryotic-like serine/threonine-protein kinase
MTLEAPTTSDADALGKDGDALSDVARVGHRLGRYQLVLPLARGGMGLVFAGRLVGSHGVERLVAIKTLRPITSAPDRAALLREARLTARLHHRNVVATLELGELDDVPYLVMELVDGVALSRLQAELAKRGEHLPPELAAWIVAQAAQGLHAAHELTDSDGRSLGLVHRDVSPQNILLSSQGEVKISDFGIAKFASGDESTATGMIKGKFAYLSPEHASSGHLDRRSDVFALGIVLWEALTGERLFAAETPARTMLRVLETTPRSPKEVRNTVDDELAAITLRCLAKDPEARYPTAAAVADVIRSALRGRGSPVDEGDLASVVQRLFGVERAEWMARLRNVNPVGEGANDALDAPGDASGLFGVSFNALAARGSVGTRSRLLMAVAAMTLLAFGIAAWSSSRSRPSEAGVVRAAASPSMAPFASAADSPPPPASAAPSATSTVAVGRASPSVEASPPRPTPTARKEPTPRASARRSASPPDPSASPIPTTVVGRPFESL